MVDFEEEIPRTKFEKLKTVKGGVFSFSSKRYYPGIYVKYIPSDTVLPLAYADYLERIKRMEVREDDIWLISFPKAEHSFTKKLVWTIMHEFGEITSSFLKNIACSDEESNEEEDDDDEREGKKEAEDKENESETEKEEEESELKGDEENNEERKSIARTIKIEEKLSENFPLLEYSGVVAAGGCNFPDTPDTILRVDRMASPRLITTHLPKDLLPDEIWEIKPKMIYITRSARSTIASSYFSHQHCAGFWGKYTDFVEAFIEDTVVHYTPFWKHVLDYWNMRNEANILIYQYEDMDGYWDLEKAIRNISLFLDKKWEEWQLVSLMQELDFKRKMTQQRFAEKKYREFYEEDEKNRKSVYDDDTFGMSPELLEMVEAWSQKWLEGSDYPYRG